MNFDILWILVILVVAGAVCWFASEPFKTKAAQLGGVAFLLWLVVQIGKYLLGHG